MGKLLFGAGVVCAGFAALSAIEHVFGRACSLWVATAGLAFALCGLLAPTQAEGDQ